MGCTFKFKKDTDKFRLDRWRTERSLFIPVLEHNNNNVVSNMAFSLNLARERDEYNQETSFSNCVLLQRISDNQTPGLPSSSAPPSPGQQTHSPAPTRKLTVESIGTLMRFQNFAVSLLSKTHRSLPVHTTVLMRFRLFTLKRSKTIDIARCDVS